MVYCFYLDTGAEVPVALLAVECARECEREKESVGGGATRLKKTKKIILKTSHIAIVKMISTRLAIR